MITTAASFAVDTHGDPRVAPARLPDVVIAAEHATQGRLSHQVGGVDRARARPVGRRLGAVAEHVAALGRTAANAIVYADAILW